MSKTIDDGGPAFPRPAVEYRCGPQEGMSLRDWFAGQALAGMMAHSDTNIDPDPTELVKYMKYGPWLIADAMLAARSKEGREP